MHSHDFYEIVLVKNGSGIHVTENSSYPIFYGDVFLILPGHSHYYKEIRDLEIVNVIFTPEAMDFPMHDLKELSGFDAFFEFDPASNRLFENNHNLDGDQLRTANEIILEMRYEQKHRETGYEYFLRLNLMRLIGLACRSYSQPSNSSKSNVSKLARILRFFEHHYKNKIRLDELVAMSGMSPSRLLRTFRNEVGETPINYLINLRMEKAAKMLRETSDPITEISYSVGFQDTNYFSKMFRRKYNDSPREYRRKNTE